MEPQFHDDPPASFLPRIRTALPDLHRAERRLGNFLLDFPGDLASYDAQELVDAIERQRKTGGGVLARLREVIARRR